MKRESKTFTLAIQSGVQPSETIKYPRTYFRPVGTAKELAPSVVIGLQNKEKMQCIL